MKHIENGKKLFCSWLLLVAGMVGVYREVAASEEALDVEFSTDIPVVLSASRLRQPLNRAPSAVTVIDRAMIDASGARTIPELFRLVPGFQVGFVNGNWQTVTRGPGDAYARQMQVLIDGRSIYSALYGGVEWSELPITMSDVERIEVVRGSSAAAYGANSFVGVINIITRDPAVEHSNMLSLSAGEGGVLDASIKLAGGENGWKYRVGLSRRADDGFPARYDANRTDIANLRATNQVNATDQLEFQGALVTSTLGRGFSSSPTSADQIHDVGADSGFGLIRWTRRLAADDEWWVQLAYSERVATDRIMLVLPLPFSPAAVDYSNKQRRSDLETQRSLALGDDLRATYGAQLRQDAAQSRPMFATDAWQTSNLTRFFGHVEWRIRESWTANVGAMYERTSLTDGSLSPRVALNWEFLSGNTLRAAWGKAERTPTLLESRWHQSFYSGNIFLGTAYLPNPNIQAEHLESSELGYIGEFPSLGLNVDLRIFEDKLSDAIYINKLAPVFGSALPIAAHQAANIDQGIIRGSELVLRWRPWEGGWVYFSAGNLNIDAQRNALVNGSPKHNSALLVEQQLPFEMKISAAIYRTGTFSWVGSQTVASQPGYDRVDLRLAKTFHSASGRGEVSLVTQNLSRGMFDYDNINIPQRMTFLRVELPF